MIYLISAVEMKRGRYIYYCERMNKWGERREKEEGVLSGCEKEGRKRKKGEWEYQHTYNNYNQ